MFDFNPKNPETFLDSVDLIDLETLEYNSSTYIALYNYLAMKSYLSHDFRQDILLKLKTHSEESLKYYKLFMVRLVRHLLLPDDYYAMKFDDPILDSALEYYTILRDFTLKSFEQFKSNMLSLYQRTLLIEVDNSFCNLLSIRQTMYNFNVKYLDPSLPEPEKILLFPMMEHASELLENKQCNELEEFVASQPHLAPKFSPILRANFLSKNITRENAMVYFNSPILYDNYTDDNICDNVTFFKFDRRNHISQVLRQNKDPDWYSFILELSKSINVTPNMRECNKNSLYHQYYSSLRGQIYYDFCFNITLSEEHMEISKYGAALIDCIILSSNTKNYEIVLTFYNQNKEFLNYYLHKIKNKYIGTLFLNILLRSLYMCNQLNSNNNLEVLIESLKVDETPSKVAIVEYQHLEKFKTVIKNMTEHVKRNGFSIFNTADEADQVKFLTDADDQKCCVICLSSIESITTVIQCGKCKMNIGHLKCLSDTWDHARNTKCPYCRH
jgi:hypothetical protein